MPPEQKHAMVHIRLDNGLLIRIDDFRFKNRFETRTAAIKWLLDYAEESIAFAIVETEERLGVLKGRKLAARAQESLEAAEHFLLAARRGFPDEDRRTMAGRLEAAKIWLRDAEGEQDSWAALRERVRRAVAERLSTPDQKR